MNTRYLDLFVIAASLPIWAGCVERGATNAPATTSSATAARTSKAPELVTWPRSSIAERSRWEAKDFFSSESALRICAAISNEDQALLSKALAAKGAIDEKGRHGMTFLYWAYLRANVPAFKLLLDSGADPDARLTEDFQGRTYQFFNGDTVMFSSIRQNWLEFCLLALPYSSNPNQLDLAGENLLHPFVSGAGGTPHDLQALISAGIDINKKGRFGCTPCHLGLTLNPSLSLTLLKANADPSIRDDAGKDIADHVEHQLQIAAPRGGDGRLKGHIAWLNENYRQIRIPAELQPADSDDSLK